MPNPISYRLVRLLIAWAALCSSYLSASNAAYTPDQLMQIFCAASFGSQGSGQVADAKEIRRIRSYGDDKFDAMVFHYNRLQQLQTNRRVREIYQFPDAARRIKFPDEQFLRDLAAALENRNPTKKPVEIVDDYIAMLYFEYFDQNPAENLTEDLHKLIGQTHTEGTSEHGVEFWRDRYTKMITMGATESGLGFVMAVETMLDHMPQRHILEMLDFIQNQGYFDDEDLMRAVVRDITSNEAARKKMSSFMAGSLLLLHAKNPELVLEWLKHVPAEMITASTEGFEPLLQIIFAPQDDENFERSWTTLMDSLRESTITNRRGQMLNWVIAKEVLARSSSRRAKRRAIQQLNSPDLEKNQIAIILSIGFINSVAQNADIAVPALRSLLTRSTDATFRSVAASLLLETPEHLNAADIRMALNEPDFEISKNAPPIIASKIDISDVPFVLSRLKTQDVKVLRSFVISLQDRLRLEYQTIPSHVAFSTTDLEILEDFSRHGFSLERDLVDSLNLTLQTLRSELDSETAYRIVRGISQLSTHADSHSLSVAQRFFERFNFDTILNLVESHNGFSHERLQVILAFMSREIKSTPVSIDFILRVVMHLEYFGENPTSTKMLYDFIITTINRHSLWGSLKTYLLAKNQVDLTFADFALAALFHLTESSQPHPDGATKKLASTARDQGQEWLNYFPLKEKKVRPNPEPAAKAPAAPTRTQNDAFHRERLYVTQLIQQKDIANILNRLKSKDVKIRVDINALGDAAIKQLIAICFEEELAPNIQLLQQQLKQLVIQSIDHRQIPMLLESRQAGMVLHALAILDHKHSEAQKQFPKKKQGLEPILLALAQRLRNTAEQRLPLRRRILDTLANLINDVGLSEFNDESVADRANYVAQSLTEYFQRDRDQLRPKDLENILYIALQLGSIPEAFSTIMRVLEPLYIFNVSEVLTPKNLAGINLVARTYEQERSHLNQNDHRLIVKGMLARMLAGFPGFDSKELYYAGTIARDRSTKLSLSTLTNFLNLSLNDFVPTTKLVANEWTNPEFQYFQFLADPTSDHDRVLRQMLSDVEKLRRESNGSPEIIKQSMEELSLYYTLITELRQGRWAFDISKGSLEGFDVKSFDIRTGQVVCIEVKSKFLGWKSLRLSAHQLHVSEAMKRDGRIPFVLSVVTFDPQESKISHQNKLYPTLSDLSPYLLHEAENRSEFSSQGIRSLKDFER